jgi:hypothetical protein
LAPDKPVLISEWFFAAHENRTGNVNNGHLMTVQTQAARAAGAAQATRNFAADPAILGLHWFQWHDHPPGGRDDGEDYNFGLVDYLDRPYGRLIEALAGANGEIAAIHARSAQRPVRGDGKSIPKAEITIGDKSLADWPKPFSLVPGIEASPDEIPFGEFHLAWSDADLSLALIAMDYYDPMILDVGETFPLEEAFRVDLAIDAGSGPRRFVLYIVPPRVFPHKGAPAFAARLCRLDGTICQEVPGGKTSYFGSDQPRITAEMTLPWSALGLATAPRDGVKLALGATAFHRSRWMSWGGKPIEELMNNPASWHHLSLGPAAKASADQVPP